ncbi:hypothetical protein [Nocardia sp. GTS18]|uniref:hypothetical protein n=1 Tax=Nocardia sp. GTS18 TaxID=1778064 RepID=UPI0015EE992E|nr:hypothetical protein [Nocardia sp. GTS18]
MSEPRLDRAVVLVELDRLEAARAELAALLAVEPDNADAHAHVAHTWLRSADFATASAAARTALRHDPEHLFAWVLLALSEHGLFDRLTDTDRVAALAHQDEAVRAAYTCVDLNPWSAECHRVLAVVLAPRDREAALAAVDVGIELDPQEPLLYITRARVLWHGAEADAQRAVAFRAALEQALRLEPDNAEAMYLLGADAARSGRRADAERWLLRAAELEPAHGPAARELLRQVPDPSGSLRDPAVRREYLGGPSAGGARRSSTGVIAVLVFLFVVGLARAVSGVDTDDASTRPTTTLRPPLTYYKPQPLPTSLLYTSYAAAAETCSELECSRICYK